MQDNARNEWKMYTLAFDTSGAGCSIALLEGERMVSSFVVAMDYGQSEILVPEIKNILEKNSLAMKDIGLLAVCVGPGSFTGVRAGISAARAFGLAVPEMAVSGISAFEVYARSLQPEELSECNAVIVETRREDFYFQTFDKSFGALEAPGAGSRQEIAKKLRGRKVSVVGDGVERFLSEPSGLCLNAIGMPAFLPVGTLAEVAVEKVKAGKTDFPKPLYLLAPDVCVK